MSAKAGGFHDVTPKHKPAPLRIAVPASLMEAADLMVHHRSRLVVMQRDSVAGVLRAQDLFFERERVLRSPPIRERHIPGRLPFSGDPPRRAHAVVDTACAFSGTVCSRSEPFAAGNPAPVDPASNTPVPLLQDVKLADRHVRPAASHPAFRPSFFNKFSIGYIAIRFFAIAGMSVAQAGDRRLRQSEGDFGSHRHVLFNNA